MEMVAVIVFYLWWWLSYSALKRDTVQWQISNNWDTCSFVPCILHNTLYSVVSTALLAALFSDAQI